MPGPDLTNSLIGVLLRFRQERIALVADIEAMYYQVRIPKMDQDLLRFLWWTDGDLNKPLEVYRMGVHIFGATSSPLCASYAFKKTAEEAENRYNKDITSTIDYLKSVRYEAEAVVLADSLMKICIEGGFNLTKWSSNSRHVLSSIPVKDRAKEIKAIDIDEDQIPTERTLGVLWSAETDTLSVVSSVYDPLGFVSPVILLAKQMMQDLCKQKLGWDQVIPTRHQREWHQWLQDMPRLVDFKVDRCYIPPGFEDLKSTQLHLFSDASECGYGVASYLRVETNSGDVHCSFVTGKSRVAPLNVNSSFGAHRSDCCSAS